MIETPLEDDGSYRMATLGPLSTAVDRFANPSVLGSLDLDTGFPYGSSFDTIAPASLDLFHTSHDDTCVDKCMGAYNPLNSQRVGFAPPLGLRPRFAMPLPLTYEVPDSSIFHPSPQVHHNIPNMFQEMSPRYDTNHTIPIYPFQLGNSFSASDLGTTPQRAVPDDCTSIDCSRFSCSSQCCSTQPCQDESCSAQGRICDDLQCPKDIPQSPEQMWNLQQSWSAQMSPEIMTQAHNQPCNHTNTEHDAAITLGAFSQFGCAVFGAGGDPVHHDRTLSSSLEPHPEVSRIPDMQAHPISPGDVSQVSNSPSEHICRWICERGETDTHDKTCGLAFNSPVDLQKHLCDDHITSMSSKTKYVCLWQGCSRRGDQDFASRNKLRRHISTHTCYKPFTCPHCHQGFSAQQALDQHIRTHTGEKPYHCDVEGCDRSFKQKSALTMHRRTHTGEKPLRCERCGKAFCESSNLSKHRKTHEPVFKYQCQEPGCDKAFIRADQLRRHMIRHGNLTDTRQTRKQQARARTRTQSLASIVTSTEASDSPETPHLSIMLDNDHLNMQS